MVIQNSVKGKKRGETSRIISMKGTSFVLGEQFEKDFDSKQNHLEEKDQVLKGKSSAV